MMNTPSKEPENWTPCEPGTLVSFSEQAKSARRRRTTTRFGVGALALIVAGFSLSQVGPWAAPPESFCGGIYCHEVQANLPAVIAGTVSGELKTRIDAHLRECAPCREALRQLRAEQAATVIGHRRLACDCPTCRRPLAQAGAAHRSETPSWTQRFESSPALLLADRSSI